MWATQEINAIGQTLNSREIGEILTLPDFLIKRLVMH